MPHHKTLLGIDAGRPPFDRLTHIELLAPARSGHHTPEHARHQLYVAREKRHRVNVLIKVTSKPGLVYERDISNEIGTLAAINRDLPDSHYFPVIHDHGRLTDGRLYLITSLFDEFPLATTIGPDSVPGRLVAHLRLAIEVSRALSEIHGIGIFHVDLNPMNVLYKPRHDGPVVRIVDFESSYERARHGNGEAYYPPTTPGYSAPEVAHQTPDARADVFSLGAVLYTAVAGYRWTDHGDVHARVRADKDLDDELRKAILTAVQPDPARRFASAEDFRTALGAYLEQIWPGRKW